MRLIFFFSCSIIRATWASEKDTIKREGKKKKKPKYQFNWMNKRWRFDHVVQTWFQHNKTRLNGSNCCLKYTGPDPQSHCVNNPKLCFLPTENKETQWKMLRRQLAAELLETHSNVPKLVIGCKMTSSVWETRVTFSFLPCVPGKAGVHGFSENKWKQFRQKCILTLTVSRTFW